MPILIQYCTGLHCTCHPSTKKYFVSFEQSCFSQSEHFTKRSFQKHFLPGLEPWIWGSDSSVCGYFHVMGPDFPESLVRIPLSPSGCPERLRKSRSGISLCAISSSYLKERHFCLNKSVNTIVLVVITQYFYTYLLTDSQWMRILDPRQFT